MPGTNTSRIEGLTTSVAVKAPCRCATTAAITLSGLQAIDGVTVAANDRVLVKNQVDTRQNGIWLPQVNEWLRAKDFDGTRDVVDGTYVFITDGTTQHDTNWRVSATNPVRIGTTAITFGVTSPEQGLPGADGAQGNPGSPAGQYPIGLFTDIANQTLPASALYIQTYAHRAPIVPYNNSGAAWYIYDTAVDAAYVTANPYTSAISANGRGYRLDLEQQLTWEMLGAPTTGAICTATISGTAMTTSSVQSGAIAIGQTVTAIGATGAVAADTVIIGGSGTHWTVSVPQTVGSGVVCMNDSWPYLSAALTLGKYGLKSTGSHWFSRNMFVTASDPINWHGPSGSSTTRYLVKFYFPAGYGGVVVGPSNLVVNAQGDVTLSGTASGSIEGSRFDGIAVQIGNGSLPAATVNNRAGVAVYSQISWTNFWFSGADGDGLEIISNSPSALADKCAFRDGTIGNSFRNNINTHGGDSNTCDFSNIVCDHAGASSAYEHGFLGNGYRLIQTQGGGQINAYVRRSNNLYYSIQDANVGNDPLTSPLFWQLWMASVGADTYDAGTTYQVGSAFRTGGNNNRSELVSCYFEGGSPPALFQSSSAGRFLTSKIGGLAGTGIDIVNGGYIGWDDGELYANNVNFVRLAGELGGTTMRNDVAATLTVGSSTQTQIWDGVFSADRAITLSTTGAVNGQSFKIVRTVASTGAFNLNVGTGPLKALAAGTWCEVQYNGSTWKLVAYGSL